MGAQSPLHTQTTRMLRRARDLSQAQEWPWWVPQPPGRGAREPRGEAQARSPLVGRVVVLHTALHVLQLVQHSEHVDELAQGDQVGFGHEVLPSLCVAEAPHLPTKTLNGVSLCRQSRANTLPSGTGPPQTLLQAQGPDSHYCLMKCPTNRCVFTAQVKRHFLESDFHVSLLCNSHHRFCTLPTMSPK